MNGINISQSATEAANTAQLPWEIIFPFYKMLCRSKIYCPQRFRSSAASYTLQV